MYMYIFIERLLDRKVPNISATPIQSASQN